MQTLCLPVYETRIRTGRNGNPEIFDPIRKKFVRLTAEEWVRQHFLNFLTTVKNYPASLITVEASLTYNRQLKRCDILVYGLNRNPLLVVECKAPNVEITQDVFDQVAMYNMTLTVEYLVVTNGMRHFACKIDQQKKSYGFLRDVPGYQEICTQINL